MVDIAPRLLQAIGEGLGWDYGTLWTVDRGDNVLRWIATWCVPSPACDEFTRLSQQMTFAPGVGLLGNVWTDGAPVWLSTTNFQRAFPRLSMATDAGLQTGVAIPIQISGQIVGIIEYFSHADREQDPATMTTLGDLGSQIGQFMERTRAEEDLRERARQQAAVAELGQRALATPDLAALIDEVAALVARVLNVTYSGVLELQPDGTLLLRAGVGWNADHLGRATIGVDSQAGYTLARNAPVIVADVDTETRFRIAPLVRSYGVVSGMNVVIHGQDRPFGVLTAYSTTRRIFTTNDVHFLQAVANVLTTAIHRAAFEQQIAREQALAVQHQELDRLRDEFIASVSHELRTPLTAARAGLGMLGTAIGSAVAPKERELLGNVRRNIERLGLRIDELLTYNQLNAGALQIKSDPLDLRVVVTDAIAALLPLIERKGQTLELDLPEPLPYIGDAQRLEQIVTNLVVNAYQHTPSGTRITVAGQRADRELTIAVCDTGPGIPADEQELIFGRFYRIGAQDGASGLGLAIVKELVELHGGRISVESRPNAGTIFRIVLP